MGKLRHGIDQEMVFLDGAGRPASNGMYAWDGNGEGFTP